MRPGQRHLYRVSSLLPEVGSSLHPPFCLSCSTLNNSENRSTIANSDYSEFRVESTNPHFSTLDGNDWSDKLDAQEDASQETNAPEMTVDRRTKKSKKIDTSKYINLICFIFFMNNYIEKFSDNEEV